MSSYSYDLVKKLSFSRPAGTAEEQKAAEIIMDEIAALGGKAEIMPFQIPACRLHSYRIKTVAPYKREIPCMAYGRTGSLPEGGRDLSLLYADDCTANDLDAYEDLSDSAVLINRLTYSSYKLLCKKHAAAFITISGKYWNSDADHDLVYSTVSENYLANGVIPGFMIRAHDATEMVRDHVSTVHLELQSENVQANSGNVLAVIPGTEIPHESIAITAHYDSVSVGTGSWDNASGAATVLYLYRYFREHAPRRTLRFIWCGAEEPGLLGSQAFVTKYQELVRNEVKFCFNFDMCGTVLGPSYIAVTGGENLRHLTEQFCREYGRITEIASYVHSSDSAHFADNGIPCLGLSRGSNSCELHSRYDTISTLSAEQLQKDGDFAIAFIERIASSHTVPISTGMPDDVKEHIARYFGRKNTTLAEDEMAKKE